MRQGQTSNRQRSRGRGGNRNSGGNRQNLNRSLESNGPDVRIRGTAAHIAEKYEQLARDAQSAGDNVAAESYWQHAEHYNRLIAAVVAQQEAQREERRAQQEAAGEEGGEEERDSNRGRSRRRRNQNRDDRQASDDQSTDDESASEDDSDTDDGDRKNGRKAAALANGSGPQPVIDGEPAEVALNTQKPGQDGDEGETKPKKRRTSRKPKADEPEPAVVAEKTSELPAFISGGAED